MPLQRDRRIARVGAWSTIVISLVLPALLGCTAQSPQIAELSGETMGTTFSIKLSPPPDRATQTAIKQQVEQRLTEINQQLSTYIPDSDLMRFNRSVSTDWQPVPIALASLVDQAKTISLRTEGLYDVTVGPLVELWGFGSSGTRTQPPTPAAIDATVARIGHQHVDVRMTPPALRKAMPSLAIDLSSIAKGWAVDQLSALLSAQGVEAFLVEIGGETRTKGKKQNGQPWRIAIERPLYSERKIQGGIEAVDIAIATSGDYRNYFEHDGQRYSHTIDPTTGSVVRHRLASVTVIAETCAEADAWATALMALGEVRAPKLAELLGIRALFIIREPEGLREHVTSALSKSQVWQTLQ